MTNTPELPKNNPKPINNTLSPSQVKPNPQTKTNQGPTKKQNPQTTTRKRIQKKTMKTHMLTEFELVYNCLLRACRQREVVQTYQFLQIAKCLVGDAICM